jgi:hypothetical protein
VGNISLSKNREFKFPGSEEQMANGVSTEKFNALIAGLHVYTVTVMLKVTIEG